MCTGSTQSPKDNFQEPAIPFYHAIGHGNQTQYSDLVTKPFFSEPACQPKELKSLQLVPTTEPGPVRYQS